MTIVQSDLIWENPEANLEKFDRHLSTINGKTDVVVLCEMFTTGFSMTPELVSEKHDPVQMKTLNWMRSWATKLDAVLCGSISVNENEKYFNRLYWVRPDGTFSTYDKRHTFGMSGEDRAFASGTSQLIEDWRGWKICPLICYDLRFPVWSRNKLVADMPLYDVLIYVANWPVPRREPWKKLLLARAIENQCFVAAANRVGADKNNNEYAGDSAFIQAKGEYIFEFPELVEAVVTKVFSRNELDEFREKFPVLSDSDAFSLL